ncbi:MAG: hypothetical protein OXC31_05135 [Spirochaetaceae bacterium]|nr:hypothetical protein [Spirochaetaceae bacterium]
MEEDRSGSTAGVCSRCGEMLELPPTIENLFAAAKAVVQDLDPGECFVEVSVHHRGKVQHLYLKKNRDGLLLNGTLSTPDIRTQVLAS